MSRIGYALAAVAALGLGAAHAAEQKRALPYYASIAPSKARMRSGPGRTYPAIWLYVRPDLPVKVVEVFKEWRKVEDPGGTQGWIQGTLIASTRTAIVTGGVAELRDRPAGARVVWRAEPGVVGRVSQCAGGWCKLDVRGQAGFVTTDKLWGVAPQETLP